MEHTTVRQLTSAVIIAAPLILICYDVFVYFTFGVTTTITDVVRGWNRASLWPEIIYVVGVVGLWLHLFRGIL